MYVCVCIVLGEKKIDKKKRIVMLAGWARGCVCARCSANFLCFLRSWLKTTMYSDSVCHVFCLILDKHQVVLARLELL